MALWMRVWSLGQADMLQALVYLLVTGCEISSKLLNLFKSQFAQL